jgi:cyanophycin synthetase
MSAGGLEVKLIDAALCAGAPVRNAAARADLLRAVGPGYAWRRLHDRAELRRLGLEDPDAACRAIWSDAARELGASVEDAGDGFLEISRNGARTRVWRHWVMLDDIVTERLALDKTLVHGLLMSAGVPIPAHRELDRSDAAGAHDFLEQAGGPCVLKPAAGTSGGEGVTGSVRTPVQLARARLAAGRYDRRLLIERQVPGEMHRLMFLDGEIVDVVRRLRPRVSGDGRSTVEELIAAENGRRLAEGHRSGLLRIDLDCVFTLAGQGLGLASVPAAEKEVVVKTASSENRTQENETVRDASPELIAETAQAVRAIGLRLAGVDVITSDARLPLAETGGAVIEVNGTPGLDYHYDVSDPASATRVAVPILSRLLGGE